MKFIYLCLAALATSAAVDLAMHNYLPYAAGMLVIALWLFLESVNS